MTNQVLVKGCITPTNYVMLYHNSISFTFDTSVWDKNKFLLCLLTQYLKL